MFRTNYYLWKHTQNKHTVKVVIWYHGQKFSRQIYSYWIQTSFDISIVLITLTIMQQNELLQYRVK